MGRQPDNLNNLRDQFNPDTNTPCTSLLCQLQKWSGVMATLAILGVGTILFLNQSNPTSPKCPDPNAIKKYGFCIWHIERYIHNFDTAILACRQQSGRICLLDEVKKAQKKGAQWCSNGWTLKIEGSRPTPIISYPMQKASSSCGGKIGVIASRPEAVSARYGVNCCFR